MKCGKNGKAQGPDKICIEMLKLIPELFVSATCALWQVVGGINFVPSLLRSGMLARIHNAEDAYKPENYRPITLLSVFLKIVSKA